jgi:hypothetical protein
MDDLIFVNNQITFLESIKSSLFQNLKWLIWQKLFITLVYKSREIKVKRNYTYPKKIFKWCVDKIYNGLMSSNHHTILVTFKLNKTKFPITMRDIITMRKIPYANVVGSLMHVLVCIGPNITYLIFHIWQFINNPRNFFGQPQNEFWSTSKLLLHLGLCIQLIPTKYLDWLVWFKF